MITAAIASKREKRIFSRAERPSAALKILCKCITKIPWPVMRPQHGGKQPPVGMPANTEWTPAILLSYLSDK